MERFTATVTNTEWKERRYLTISKEKRYLTSNEFLILSFIEFRGDTELSVPYIARTLNLACVTVHRMLKTLEAAGIIVLIQKQLFYRRKGTKKSRQGGE